MRAFLSQTLAAQLSTDSAQPSTNSAQPSTNSVWMPGLPHVLAALTVWPVFGAAACATALLMTSLITFVLWLPLTALALNHGEPVPEDAHGPVLTLNARRALLLSWTATAWAVAWMLR